MMKVVLRGCDALQDLPTGIKMWPLDKAGFEVDVDVSRQRDLVGKLDEAKLERLIGW
jgi:hypothetical protein